MNVTFEFAGQQVSAYWNEKTYGNGTRYVEVKRGYQSARGTYDANENIWAKRVGSPAYDAAIESAFGWTPAAPEPEVAPEPEIQEEPIVAPAEIEKENEMIWNNETESYRGKTSDGKVVDVTATEWAESLWDGIKSYAENNNEIENFNGDITTLPEALCQKYENLTLIELDDPDMWAALAGDNPNVEIL